MFLLRRFAGRSHDADASEKQGDLSLTGYVEDEVSRKALDQASEDVREGKYERALWLLEKLGHLYPAAKEVAELVAVAEVCHAAVLRSCMCLSRENKTPDWYKILKVDEKSDVDSIKKRYRQLALLLHPDKNKHVKAEAAFKLVLEAYACLSDKKKCANFNVERSIRNCRRCNPRDSVTSGSDRWSSCDSLKEKKIGLRRPDSSPDLTQSDWILDQERLKMFRARARARVFGKLAKAWKARDFKGMEEVNRGRERFNQRELDQRFWPAKGARKNADHWQCKDNINELNANKLESLKVISVFSSKIMKNEINKLHNANLNVVSGNVNENNRTPEQQLSRPRKNLEILIRNIQAELNSSGECTGDRICMWEKTTRHVSLAENVLNTDGRDSGNILQGSNGTLIRRSGPHADGDCASLRKVQSLLGASSAAFEIQANIKDQGAVSIAGKIGPSSTAQKCSRLYGSSGDDLFEIQNNANFSNELVSRIWSHKGESSDKDRGECNSEFKCFPSETIFESLLNPRSEERDHDRTAMNDVESTSFTSTILEKPDLHRPIGILDSLDIEETILQTQKEKSEQLLKTLQRLREETKSVAASLDRFCYGRSSKVDVGGGSFE